MSSSNHDRRRVPGDRYFLTSRHFLQKLRLPLWLQVSLLAILCISSSLASTSLTPVHRRSSLVSLRSRLAPLKTDSLIPLQDCHPSQPLLGSALRTLPMLAIGTSYCLYNEPIRSLRNAHTPQFRHQYDDYLQFAPLVTMLGMKACSIEGSSTNHKQFVLGNAIAYGSMLGLVHLGKQITGVLRPDGSAHNSFPSGHTAMAFTSATLLHAEYGGRYPWLSALSYATATAVGVGRILNNRHWIGDVAAGAALGYACGIFGYWLSERLLGGGHRNSDFLNNHLIPNRSLNLYLPIRYSSQSLAKNKHLRYRSIALGLGLRWQYSPRGYYIAGELAPSLHQFEDEGKTTTQRTFTLSLGWGQDLRLWREHIYLSIGSYIQVDTPLSSINSYTNYLDNPTTIMPKIIISPRWKLTSRLGVSLDFSTLYRLSSQTKIDRYKEINGWSINLGSSIWLTL